MGQGDCVAALQTTPSAHQARWALVPVLIHNEQYELELHFGDDDRLERMRVDLYQSRSFWDDDPPWDTSDVVALYEQAKTIYHSLIDHARTLLGPPTFSGTWEEPDYPEGEVSANLTYWTHHGDRLQVIQDHPDKEFPIVVALESYPLSNEAPKLVG
jgi:hypothetical protein